METDRSHGRPAATATRGRTRLLVVLLVLLVAAAAVLGLRTWRTGTLLSSAYELGVPGTSTVRPWMTLRYVSIAYRAPEAELRQHLSVPADADPDATLRSLARRAGASAPDYLQRVQRSIAAVAPATAESSAVEAAGSISTAGESVVSAVIAYGYPALALTLALGALGVPLPSGLSLVVAGSLAAQGTLRWDVLAAVATFASVAGDVAGYGAGRLFGDRFVERRGRWLGLTPARLARAGQLFDRWGAVGLVLSRSLVSALSSAVNLVAGASRYSLAAFVAFGIAGRLAWTAAYLGLGVLASGGLEHATDFLAHLTGLLVVLALLGAAAAALRRDIANVRAV